MENIDALIEYLINDNPRYHVSEEPETFASGTAFKKRDKLF